MADEQPNEAAPEAAKPKTKRKRTAKQAQAKTRAALMEPPPPVETKPYRLTDYALRKRAVPYTQYTESGDMLHWNDADAVVEIPVTVSKDRLARWADYIEPA